MKKTIRVNELKERINILVNNAIRYSREGNKDLFNHSYTKAINYVNLIEEMCIDYKKTSYQKEFSEIEEWFTEITNNAIFK